MIDMASCMSDNSLNPCSTNDFNSQIIPSIQTSVDYLYKITLSGSQKLFMITLTWRRHALALHFGSTNFKTTTLRRKRGSKTLNLNSSVIEISWDLSSAKYHTSRLDPETGFYVLVVIDSEIGLALGDPVGKSLLLPVAKASVVSRRDTFIGREIFSTTRARFCDWGAEHEIVIRRGKGEEDEGLGIWMDKKRVMCVKKLRWNFRGNETMFVDGLMVDLMWDVHDWFFGNLGSAVFMFKTRKCLDSTRLWLIDDEKKMKDGGDFSLFIIACRTP